MRNVKINESVVSEVVKQYGTPCLCYEQTEIEFWCNALLNALPKESNLIYSVKASPSIALIQYYNKRNLYFETASKGELMLLLAFGVDPKRIWVSGQGKTADYLQYAVSNNVTNYNFESENEIKIFTSITKHYSNCSFNCNIRINPCLIGNTSVIQMGGAPSPYGIDESQMESVLSKYHDCINGIFVYAGSQLFSEDTIISNTRYILNLAKKYYEITGKPAKSIDFGGGFGVPEDDSNHELDMTKLNDCFNELFSNKSNIEWLSSTDLFFESGRYLSARTAVLITSVLDVKQSNEKNFLILDGGINQLGVKQAEYRIFSPPVRHIPSCCSDPDTSKSYSIYGCTCTPIDLIHPDIELCNPLIGDYICILDCGGYSVTFSPQNFNGYFTVPEILHDNDHFIHIKKRGDFFSTFLFSDGQFIGNKNEIQDLVYNSVPKESDEIENIIIASSIAKVNNNHAIIVDICDSPSYDVILYKVLKHTYGLDITGIYTCSSDYRLIEKCVGIKSKSLSEISFCSNATNTIVFVVTGGLFNSDFSSIIKKISGMGFVGVYPIQSELIDSMELDFYDYFIKNIDKLQVSFNLMKDLKSKEVFLEYIRTVLENDYWTQGVNSLVSKYWGYDDTPQDSFYTHLSHECWLNIGCCNGDTIFRYILNGFKFSNIYAVDTDRVKLRCCQSNLEQIKTTGQIHYLDIAFGIDEGLKKIDDFIFDSPITLINMDIEGQEKSVILSGINTIRKYRPVIAICAYHCPSDLVDLVSAIYSISSDYVFYLRKYPNYSFHRYNSKEEIVLYAIPPERAQYSGERLW